MILSSKLVFNYKLKKILNDLNFQNYNSKIKNNKKNTKIQKYCIKIKKKLKRNNKNFE